MTLSLIVDCDPGNGLPATDVDDGLALALALASPEVELAAVTVVEGNVDHATGAAVARALLALAGSTAPVFEGHATAEREPVPAWRAALAARRNDPLAAKLWSGLAPRLLPANTGTADAVDALLDLTATRPGHHTLVTLGPLTNVAAAQRRDPGFLARLRRIVMLAGAFTGPLGVRELNVALDPEAAETVLGSGAPVTLVPLDLTRTTWLTPDDVEALAAAPSPFVRYLAATARPWVHWIVRSRGWPGANLHDVAAVAAAIDPGLVTSNEQAVAVELTGELTRSRLVRLPDEVGRPGPTPRPERRTVRVATDIDRKRFSALVVERLTSFGGPA